MADNITPGLAQGDLFRTTRLWGIGKRFFFLHDGRTSDLLAAIEAHASSEDEDNQGSGGRAGYPSSEANAVIRKFSKISAADKQAIRDFQRSL